MFSRSTVTHKATLDQISGWSSVELGRLKCKHTSTYVTWYQQILAWSNISPSPSCGDYCDSTTMQSTKEMCQFAITGTQNTHVDIERITHENTCQATWAIGNTRVIPRWGICARALTPLSEINGPKRKAMQKKLLCLRLTRHSIHGVHPGLQKE